MKFQTIIDKDYSLAFEPVSEEIIVDESAYVPTCAIIDRILRGERIRSIQTIYDYDDPEEAIDNLDDIPVDRRSNIDLTDIDDLIIAHRANAISEDIQLEDIKNTSPSSPQQDGEAQTPTDK